MYGRLNKGYLGLPPEDFILDLFALGIDSTGILPTGQKFLTAQQVWPFIASALSTQGTARPYWFLVSKCDDLPKLINFMNRIESMGNAFLRKRLKEIKIGIQSIIDQKTIDTQEIIVELNKAYDDSDRSREHLVKLLNGEEIPKENLTDYLMSVFDKFISGSLPLGEVIVLLLKNKSLEEDGKYWIRQSVSALNKYEDRNGLISVYYNPNFKAYHSKCRKLMRMIDFREFGPSY